MAVVFVAGVLLFLYAWSIDAARPGLALPHHTYYAGYDQSGYLNEAKALRHLRLPATRPAYAFGLGYPSLAVPFLWLSWPNDPYVVPDALLFGATLALTMVVGARLRSVGFGVFCAAALAFATPLLSTTVTPWSNTVTVVAVIGAVALATAPASRPPTWRAGLLAGALVGITFAARYVDAIFPAVIVLMAWGRHWRRCMPALLALGALVLVAVGGVLLTHARVFGSPWTTPYAEHMRPGAGSDQAVSSYDLGKVPRDFVGVFLTGVDRGFVGRRVAGDPLLRVFPWVVLAPFGWWRVVRTRHPLRWVMSVVAGISVAGSVFYLSFRAVTPDQLVYGNLRYFEPWFAPWALLAGLAVVGGWQAGRRRLG